jgi:hypothetical protein
MAESKRISRIKYDQMGVLNGFVIQQSIEILTTYIHSQPDGRLKSKVVVLSIKRTRARIVKQAASVDVSGMDLERQ